MPPSTNHERHVLLLLRKLLPEYEINPHMRLANVVRGKIPYNYVMGQYEIDFVVQNPTDGSVVCAIELDDATHDTSDGQRRDNNKNRWLAMAGVKLIRIRSVEEASNIRQLIGEEKIPSHHVDGFNFTEPTHPDKKPFIKLMQIAVSVAMAFSFFMIGFGRLTQPAAPQITPEKLTGHPHPALPPLTATLPQPRYSLPLQFTKKWIPGKSARECSSNGVFDNGTVDCMKGHYETIPVLSGNN